MNLQHVNVKVFVDGELTVDWERFIEVFHRWVAAQSTDEMLIDVADYRHVPNGPGVVLVGHEADYSLDNTGGRPGLRYNCKVAGNGTNDDRLRHVLGAAAKACLRLEDEFEGLKFSRQQIELFINDRAIAPNDDATRKANESKFTSLLASALNVGEVSLEFNSDPRTLFGAVASFSNPFDLAALAKY